MKETWGPPIKDGQGRACPPFRLPTQYSLRKRRGTTPPEDQPVKKKHKKQHKRFTAPGGTNIRDAHDSDDHITLPGPVKMSRSEGKKPVVLLPPMPDIPNGKTCVRCGSGPKDLDMLVSCAICFRRAYCSFYCRNKRRTVGKKCSVFCAAEELDEEDLAQSSSSSPESDCDGDCELEASDQVRSEPPHNPDDFDPEDDAGHVDDLDD